MTTIKDNKSCKKIRKAARKEPDEKARKVNKRALKLFGKMKKKEDDNMWVYQYKGYKIEITANKFINKFIIRIRKNRDLIEEIETHHRYIKKEGKLTKKRQQFKEMKETAKERIEYIKLFKTMKEEE